MKVKGLRYSLRKVTFVFKMLRTGTGILSNIKIIIQKRDNGISFSHWTDEKFGKSGKSRKKYVRRETKKKKKKKKVGRMASLRVKIVMTAGKYKQTNV